MTAVNELTRGEVTLSTTKTQLEDAEQKLADAQEQFDQARDAAYKKADLSGVLTADMLGNILMAQNFNMHSKAETETLWPAPRKCGAGFFVPAQGMNKM